LAKPMDADLSLYILFSQPGLVIQPVLH